MGWSLRDLGYRTTNNERRDAMRGKWWAPAGFAAAALIVAACGSSSSGSGGGTAVSSSTPSAAASAPQSSGKKLQVTTIGSKTVLTNAQGFTLYWFVPDTSHQSNCNGDCAQHWHPVPGPAKAGTGVTGTLTTITRSDGSTQAAYDGHPLYTYVADTAPGMAKGNGLTIAGGKWWEMTASGATPAPAQSASTGGGGGGYGY
jgi:predicted lipoprotein with Yx(FWY)xxD motif